jgi:cytidylate kinase
LSKPITIAIDGPAASGKTTIGGELAKRLNYLFFDTGVMYRAVTWAALRQGLSVYEETEITALAQQLHIDVVLPTVNDGRPYTVMADGQDVTELIRDTAVEAGVSSVSAYPGVRAALVAQQQRIGARGQIVMAGRDIGTVVLPDADIKIYLDARVEERASRRYHEQSERGKGSSYENVLTAMRRRDEFDSGREISPLHAADDAIIIDTSDLTADQVLDIIEGLIRERIDC